MGTRKAVLVTGIGGNVGQGILRNLRAAYGRDVRVVGTDVADVTAGHYFCDESWRTPYYFDASFVDALSRICATAKPDLIIPSTDGEMVAIGRSAGRLPPFIGPPPEIAEMFLDKYRTAQAFAAAGLPFAPSCLPSEFDGKWPRVVVKPREGRGSRDVHFVDGSVTGFDDRFLVQRRVDGVEITSSFYATRDGRRLGPITFERRLQFGMTVECTVVTRYDKVLAAFADRLLAAHPFEGPCNVQAIVEDGSGEIVPFEINGRYSGTNSIRSHFGFEDVRYGVEEFLFGRKVGEPALIGGSALRLMMDIVYPGVGLGRIAAGSAGARLC